MFRFVGEFLRQFFKLVAIYSAIDLRIQFGQGGKNRFDSGIFFESLSTEPAQMVAFLAGLGEEGADDRFLGGGKSTGESRESFDLVSHESGLTTKYMKGTKKRIFLAPRAPSSETRFLLCALCVLCGRYSDSGSETV